MFHASDDTNTPLIPPEQKLPEITLKAVILALILVGILAAANAYLGLKVGTTVAASIPAAVVSMGVLRLFRNSNVLENNIVQTAASAGEALVAGIAYILPALLITQYWSDFSYWDTVFIAIVGGILGVLFSIPLRRVLLAHPLLRFPEGTAIGQVLKASTHSKEGLSFLIKGGSVGGIISLAQTGFQVVANGLQFWSQSASGIIYGFGLGFDPALIAAGYIIGLNVGLSILAGVAVGWLAGIPLLSYIHGIPLTNNPAAVAMKMWHEHVRYIGVGTMLVGGFWTLVTLIKPIIEGLRSSFVSLKSMRGDKQNTILRTDYDIPIHYAGIGILLVLIPLGLLFYHFVTSPQLQASILFPPLLTTVVALVFILIVGFIFSALSGYFVGLVGSTNSPGSAFILSSLLMACSLILVFLSLQPQAAVNHPAHLLPAAAFAIIITSVIGAATVVTNETIQDLKAGQMVGATPWKQQMMMIIGVLASAFVIPLILQLLFHAYGIGGVFPRPGMDPNQMLAAPQAGLMAALAEGVFSHNLPGKDILVGAIIAVIAIVIDRYLRNRNTALPVLAVGLGIYLPLEASMPVAVGGTAAAIVGYILKRQHPAPTIAEHEIINHKLRTGLILACGIVAGAALVGVLLAIPFALAKSSDVLSLAPPSFAPIAKLLGIVTTIGLLVWIYRVVCNSK